MTRSPPPWLAEFQREFSAALRTPLARSTGTLRAEPARYPAGLVAATLPGARTDAPERLAVYNRQYWARLFQVLQSELPLVAHLLGGWTFNGEAAAFLEVRPPAGHALADVANGFADFLVARGARGDVPLPGGALLPGLALAQAARLDDAFRAVFWSREPDPAETAAFQSRLARAGVSVRLCPSGRFVLVQQDWPLVELRGQLGASPPDHPARLPARLASARHAAVYRTPTGAAVLPLAAPQATLYRALGEVALPDALARLEAGASADELGYLHAHVGEWMARSVQLGFWDAVEPG